MKWVAGGLGVQTLAGGAEMPGMTQKGVEGLHLDNKIGRKEDNHQLMRKMLAQRFVQGAGEHNCLCAPLKNMTNFLLIPP